MLGPLPALHRWTVAVLAVVACIGLGAWLASFLPVPLLAPAGAGLGAALGLVLVLLLVRDHRHRPGAVRSGRSRRPR